MEESSLFERLEGFRLNRFEMLNWGTFNQKVWKIEPRNHNALLTGDIGSGKSTLVDALTILLVPRPSNLIVFNKAAGAQAQERSLRSYVLGEYKNEVDAESQKARAVPLRDHRSYSVLLACFYNQTTNQSTCLAQVFFFREKGGQPDRLFVVSEHGMSIAEDFKAFADIQELRSRLRKNGAKVCDSLKDYAAQFRRLMGIANDRALELFYQTLSMKSVSDLTQFVREHMLEGDDSRERVEKLCLSFEDLDRSHKAVVKARHQIELLQPIARSGLDYREKEKESSQLRQQRDLLEPWRAQLGLQLEKDKECRLEEEVNKTLARIAKSQSEEEQLLAKKQGYHKAISENGGSRLQELDRDEKRLQQELVRVQESRQIFGQRIAFLNFAIPESHEEFTALHRKLQESHTNLVQVEEKLDQQTLSVRIQWQNAQGEIKLYQDEIESLEGRPSNIPKQLLELRRALCQTLDLPLEAVPFAGELIQVLPEAAAWEGAIERVLHNFALSLLVSENDYARVSEWVERTHLRGRIVYFKLSRNPHPVDWDNISEESLLRKIALKADHRAYAWLISRLADRFDYRCCKTLDDFRRSTFGLTQQGQIKSGGDRHEKDDRHPIGDRSRFVLGWDSQAKLRALRQRLQEIQSKAQDIAQDLADCDIRRSQLREQVRKMDLVLEVRSFALIDQKGLMKDLEALHQERDLIEKASSKLRELQDALGKVEAQFRELNQQMRDLQEKRADLNSDLKQCRLHQDEAIAILQDLDSLKMADFMPYLQSRYDDLFTDPPNLQNLKARERTMREKIQAEMDALDKRLKTLRDNTIKSMQDYCKTFAVESVELDASMESLDGFCQSLKELQDDGLPAFEERFKQELNEKTIQSIAHFQNRLERSQREIKDRLRQINASLKTIDYNEGTFIELQAKDNLDGDIRQFRNEVRACLEGSLNADFYNEQSFLRVKALIERFKGREGSLEADRRWTNRVTDVRFWFEFAAHEIYRDTGASKEYYESGSAKSGGQKEKLAYTVLASALAYQYGINEEASYARSFRFVCIDEAFGKGSDESTRYGLELFRRLGLQLLVVTPLQKIRVIEDYVQAVHFVHNEAGKNSKLRNLSIDEYRQMAQEHHRGDETPIAVQINSDESIDPDAEYP